VPRRRSIGTSPRYMYRRRKSIMTGNITHLASVGAAPSPPATNKHRYSLGFAGASAPQNNRNSQNGQRTSGAQKPAQSVLSSFTRSKSVGTTFQEVVLELGPGGSTGMRCPLLSGAHSYVAYAYINHTDRERNSQVFRALVTMFRDSTRKARSSTTPREKSRAARSQVPRGRSRRVVCCRGRALEWHARGAQGQTRPRPYARSNTALREAVS
jgi:hypothetical protein